MNGKGRWQDNRMVERLRRSLKYECVYLQEFEDGREAREVIGEWFEEYNRQRPHKALGWKTPAEVYFGEAFGGEPREVMAA